MNILLNVPYNLFEASSMKKYTGPLHFSSILIQNLKQSSDSFTGMVFEKTKKREKAYFKSRLVKKGKDSWLVFNIWLPTAQIVASHGKSDPETRMVIEKIKKAISQTNPDVFFLNGFSALTFLLMQAAHELNIPTVCTHHGLWLKEYLALNKKLTKTPIKDRKELEKDTVRYAQKNIFLSKLSLREFNKHLMKVPKSQLEFIKIPYNPVFLNKKLPPRNKQQDLNILMVGRWDAVKNHEDYLALAKRAKEKGLPWTFYTVSNIIPYPHYDHIRDEYQKFIKVIPTMSAPDLKEMYRKSNVTINLSHFDVYPGVVTEAILQNRPTLISKNVGWVDEFKRHKIAHWITDFKNPDKVLAKIAQVSQEDVPKSLYNEVLKENNPNYVFKKYHQLFDEVGGKKRTK